MVRVLWSGVLLLSLIMLVVASRRILHVFGPGVELDAGFAQHPLLTLAHILPGMIFVVLGPFQFISRLRREHPALHRWAGRVFLVDAVLVGATALVMSPQMAIGGTVEIVATYVFGLLFLFALLQAFTTIRRRDVAQHRRWMIRAYAIGLGVGTVRPIMAVFFATSRITHLSPRDFFGIAFFLGFALSLAAAEMWIRRRPVVGQRAARL